MDVYKKGILYICVALLICCAGYWLGSRENIHSDGAGIDGAVDDLREAGQQAEATESALGSAGGAVDDASGTAGDIEKTNQQLTDGNAEIADLIGYGESIIEGIRGRGEKRE